MTAARVTEVVARNVSRRASQLLGVHVAG